MAGSEGLPRIAVFSGPLATVGNTAPLVTSHKARAKYGLASAGDGVDVLRPQRLAAPAVVYVEAFSAHPLEADAADNYAPPDGWLDADGRFHAECPPGGGTPVYEVELRPEDGLYPLPYMARQADGQPWEDAATEAFAPTDRVRQTFFPDASRLYEEIDRFGYTDHGRSVQLSAQAGFDFFRAAPPGGWTRGRESNPPEVWGRDFFPYAPYHLYREPTLESLADATNLVQETLASGDYEGAQWLEGSASIEDTLYWLNLTIDTPVPIVGHSAQRAHGTVSCDGDRNVVDGVKYILSRVWADDSGRDSVGAVLVVDELVYSSREVTKTDARPGGYEVVGAHGGVVGDIGGEAPPQITFRPNRRHTHRSSLRLSDMPVSVSAVEGSLDGSRSIVEIVVRDDAGRLNAAAMPSVSFTKSVHYVREAVAGDAAPDPGGEVEILARIDANLAAGRLAGFVVEGAAPYGTADPAMDSALRLASLCGMPVVRVAGGRPGGRTYKGDPLSVAADNLASSKARILLMAALLKLGALPVASDPFDPARAEIDAVVDAVARYQEIFDTH